MWGKGEKDLLIIEGKDRGEIQGFLDDEGNFLDRKEAMIHARACGQVDKTTCPNDLFSEDLW